MRVEPVARAGVVVSPRVCYSLYLCFERTREMSQRCATKPWLLLHGCGFCSWQVCSSMHGGGSCWSYCRSRVQDLRLCARTLVLVRPCGSCCLYIFALTERYALKPWRGFLREGCAASCTGEVRSVAVDGSGCNTGAGGSDGQHDFQSAACCPACSIPIE